MTSKNPTKVQHYLLPSRNSTLNIDEANWYKLNYDASGYYIVNYDIKNWNGLMKQLKEDHSVFSILDRASMIKDAFTMVEEGLLPYKVVLDLTTYLKKVSIYSKPLFKKCYRLIKHLNQYHSVFRILDQASMIKDTFTINCQGRLAAIKSGVRFDKIKISKKLGSPRRIILGRKDDVSQNKVQ